MEQLNTWLSDALQSLHSRFSDEITFAKRKNFLVAVSCVFLTGLLSYGYTFFNHIYNNDGLLRILENEATVRGSLITGRWFYYPLSHLYFEIIRLPLFHGLISVCQLIVCVLLTWKLFDIRSLTARILSGSMFMTLPVFMHFFFYLGDSEVYSAGMIMSLWSVFLFRKQSILHIVGAVVLIAAALGCYPALFSFIVCTYMLHLFHHFKEGEKVGVSITRLLKAIALCVAGLLVYYFVTHLLLSVFDFRLLDYKNSNDITAGALFLRFPGQVLHVLFLVIRFLGNSSIWYQLVFAGGFIGMLMMIWQQHRHTVVGVISGFFLAVCVLISSLAAYLITFETYLYPGFAFGMMILSALLVTYPLVTFPPLLRRLYIILSLTCILVHLREVNAISLKNTLSMHSGQQIINQIGHDLLRHPAFDKEKTQVAFVGDLSENNNYDLVDPLIKIKAINGVGNAPVGFAFRSMSEHIGNHLLLQGIRLRLVPPDSTDIYLNVAMEHQMPEYPEEGSLAEHGNVLIVNLGTTPDR